jgi:hypothetical protein
VNIVRELEADKVIGSVAASGRGRRKWMWERWWRNCTKKVICL